jgi:hypothetical protein
MQRFDSKKLYAAGVKGKYQNKITLQLWKTIYDDADINRAWEGLERRPKFQPKPVYVIAS